MSAAPRWRSAGQNDLAENPELGAVVLLDAALGATVESLHAFVPELDPRAATWSNAGPLVLAARDIIVHARHLRNLIDHYRHELDPPFKENGCNDDIDF
jgi:hypothetical protein